MRAQVQQGLHPVGTLAKLWRCSERTVQQAARDGIIPKAKRGQYDLIACTGAMMDHLREVASARKSEDGGLDLVAERARLAKEQADGQEIKNALARADLVLPDATDRATIALATAVSSRLQAIGTRTAPALAAEDKVADCQKIVDEAVDQALHELADAAEAARVRPRQKGVRRTRAAS